VCYRSIGWTVVTARTYFIDRTRPRAMPATEGASYPSPFILDLDMSENPEEPDFDFFDVDTSFVTTSSPSAILLDESTPQNHKYRTGLEASASVAPNPDSSHQSSFSDVGLRTVSAPSSGSPAGSFRDSSSDSSMYKRKSSSDSSHSAFTSKDILMTDTERVNWNTDEMMTGGEGGQFGGFDGTINPSTMSNTFGFNDKVMENDFDFDSAASSPTPFGAGPVAMESPEMPTIKYDTPRKSSPKFKLKGGHHAKMNSVIFLFFIKCPLMSYSLLDSLLTSFLATFCHAIYEWPYNQWLSRGVTLICRGD
jgi:hypothetical protein